MCSLASPCSSPCFRLSQIIICRTVNTCMVACPVSSESLTLLVFIGSNQTGKPIKVVCARRDSARRRGRKAPTHWQRTICYEIKLVSTFRVQLFFPSPDHPWLLMPQALSHNRIQRSLCHRASAQTKAPHEHCTPCVAVLVKSFSVEFRSTMSRCIPIKLLLFGKSIHLSPFFFWESI
jgi:hypothetical protein